MINERTNFYYDPKKEGYDTTIWKTTSGTPTVSSDKIRLNNSAIIGYGDFMSADLIMALTLPTAPTTGDSRFFGFSQLTNGSKAGFDITDDVFTAKIVDNAGTATSETINWNASWTASQTNFRIHWSGFDAEFWVNEEKLAVIHNVDLIKYPLSVRVVNSNSDNLDLSWIQVKNASFFGGNKLNIGNLITDNFDYVSLTYTGSNLTGLVYKSGGASGKTVATLTLGYDLSNNIISIAKS